MPLMDHLRELRRRLIIIVLVICLGAIAGWLLYNPLMAFLQHPYCQVNESHRYHIPGKSCALVYTGVLDGFVTRLKVSFIAGVVFSSPLWLYQVWAFIVPGLRKNERKYTIIFLGTAIPLFGIGMALAYAVLSKGLNILLGQAGNGVTALLTVNQYLSFVTMMLVVFGAAFELPLLVIMANFAGALPAKWLRKSQRIAIFLIFLFAAVATPTTDPFTMCALAVPMVLLYEAAVIIASVHDRRKARRKADERARADAQNAIDDDTPSVVNPFAEPIEAPRAPSVSSDDEQDSSARAGSWSDIT